VELSGLPVVINDLIEQSRSLETVGDIDGAFRLANQAVRIAQADGDSDAVAAALLGVAFLHFRIGHDGDVIHLARQALALSSADSMWKVDALMMLGAAGEGDDYMHQRKERYLQVIDLARQIGYHRALIRALHNLAAGVYMPWGQFELALAADREAAKLIQTYQMTDLAWAPLHTTAWILWRMGRFQEAHSALEALAACSQPGSMGDAYVSLIHANLLVEEGDFEEAHKEYERSRGLGEKNGSPEIGISVRLGLSRIERAQRNGPAAHRWAEDALEITRRVEYPHQEGIALLECGRAAWCVGDLEKAENYLRLALEKLNPLRAGFELALGSLLLAALLLPQRHPDAESTWAQAVRLVVDNGYDFLLEQERALVLPFIAAYLDRQDAFLAKSSRELAEHLLNVPPAPIKVQTLGLFRVRVGASVISKESLRQRRAGELLILLLVKPGHCLTSSQVSEALCPEKDPDAAVNFYHHAISALRRLLEPDLPDRRFLSRYVEASEERVTLQIPPGSSNDFVEFEQHIQQKAWAKAIAIYQGEFLPIFRYAEWSIPFRQHFADQFEQALLALAAERLSTGDALGCLELTKQALLHNPWQEQAVEMGMRAALALGNRIGAIKLYQRLEKDLNRDLGIEPQVALQQLYLDIKKRRA
jgi:DNA-binding SARP family transcriptional activator